MVDRVKNKIALVSGGGSGIGQASAKKLAAEGAVVYVTDINDARGKITVAEIQQQGGQANYLPLDVTSEACWKQCIKRIIEKHKSINIVVNNAGVVEFSFIGHTALEGWNRVIDVNLTNVFLGTKNAIKAMRKSDSIGSIMSWQSSAVPALK